MSKPNLQVSFIVLCFNEENNVNYAIKEIFKVTKLCNLKKFQVNKKTFINNLFICFRDTFPDQRLKFISNQYNLTKNNV